MVLQRIELEGKANSSHFLVFGFCAASREKHGFAEKLHFKLIWLANEAGAFATCHDVVSLKNQE